MSSTTNPPLLLNGRLDSPVSRDSCYQLVIKPLGSGNEAGRSCVYMSYLGKNILFDCGVHPAYSSLGAMPYFEHIDLTTVDVILVTSFHLDHAGALPFFLEKTVFKGTVLMTPSAKRMYRLLLSDYVKISKGSVKYLLYDELDVLWSMDKIQVIEFHQTIELNGIRIQCYPAGHVLGAAMFKVEIAGVSVLYTGDYLFEEDRHLRAAVSRIYRPSICIIESTNGTRLREPRHVREKGLRDVIHLTIAQGGRVLIPAYALGHSVELLSHLDEYWSNHPKLHNIPIYHVSTVAKSCRAIYQAYIDSMNDRSPNPFDLKHISPLNSIEDFDDVGPCVVIASPSGLESGLSRQFFDKWCSDEKNACVIPEYVVEGTLARTISSKPKPKDVTLVNGLTAPLNMQVHYMPSFSGHADFVETSAFLKAIMPRNVVLVNGEPSEMGRLKQYLITMFSHHRTAFFSPKNCQTVEIYFISEEMAKTISGRLVEKTRSQINTRDLHHVISPKSNQRTTDIPYSGAAFGVLSNRLKQMYESVESGVDEDSNVPTLRVHDRVTVKLESDKHLSLHWTTDPISDTVSDSIVATVQNTSREMPESDVVQPTEEHNQTDMEGLYRVFLASLFEDVINGEDGKLVITTDSNVAYLDKHSGDVECEDEGLKERVKTAVRLLQSAVKSNPTEAQSPMFTYGRMIERS